MMDVVKMAVGATPWRQQVALLIGCLVGALVIAPVLNLLYEAYGFPGAMPRAGMDPAQALSAPQAVLMTTIAQGIFSSKLAWEYIYIGIGNGQFLGVHRFTEQSRCTLTLRLGGPQRIAFLHSQHTHSVRRFVRR